MLIPLDLATGSTINFFSFSFMGISFSLWIFVIVLMGKLYLIKVTPGWLDNRLLIQVLEIMDVQTLFEICESSACNLVIYAYCSIF